MTELSVLDQMRQALRDGGYKWNTQPQESMMPHEVVIILDSMTLPMESTTTYLASITYDVQWLEMNIDEIPASIVRMITTLEGGVDSPTFRVEKNPSIKILGTMYRVSIKVSYRERVVIV